MEEEDVVVAEIPVLLSQALAQNLYIYQYPLRPETVEWNDTKVLNSLIKPVNKQVRMEFGLDTYSDKYCASKGEQIALNTDGYQESSRYMNRKEQEKSQYFKTGTMDKLVYESVAPSVGSNYAVAILQDKELHCTPVKGLVQMRPCYSYYDKQDQRTKDSKKVDNSDDEEEEEQTPQKVTVSFARQETEGAKKARENSYEFVSKKSAEEPWCDTVWRHSNSDHAELERLKLFSPHSTGAALSLPPPLYLPALVPPPPSEESAPPADRRTVLRATLVEQCRALLKEAKLITFGNIAELLQCGKNKLAAVSALGTAGGCVRGLWTAQSGDLYRQGARVPPALLAAARDHVIYLFTQSPFLDRQKISASIRLPPEEILEILQSISRYNPNTGGWELLLPPDPVFESSFPDLVHRQNLYWEAKHRQFLEMMSTEREAPRRQRKKSQRESFSSDTMLSPKARHNSTGEDEGDRKRHKNKSSTGVGKRTRNHSVGNESAL